MADPCGGAEVLAVVVLAAASGVVSAAAAVDLVEVAPAGDGNYLAGSIPYLTTRRHGGTRRSVEILTQVEIPNGRCHSDPIIIP